MSQKFVLPSSFSTVRGSEVLAVSQFSTLKAGRHVCIISAVLPLHDFEKVGKYDSATKSYSIDPKPEKFLQDRPWKNNSTQLAVVFKNDKGVITEYYNLEGFFEKEEIEKNLAILRDPRTIELNGWTPEFAGRITLANIDSVRSGDKSYAVLVKKTGAERIISPDKTTQCHSILSQVLVASGEEVGEDLFDAISNLGQAVLDGNELIVDVEVVERKLSADVRSRMAKDMESVFEVKRVRTVDLSLDYSNLTPSDKPVISSMSNNIDDLM